MVSTPRRCGSIYRYAASCGCSVESFENRSVSNTLSCPVVHHCLSSLLVYSYPPDIQELIVKSLVCVDDTVAFQPNAFELFGYDVLIDQDLRSWLVEVNSSPSMATDSDLDKQVKGNLIRDTIRLVCNECDYGSSLPRLARSSFIVPSSSCHMFLDLFPFPG
jgi:hypothetical protein